MSNFWDVALGGPDRSRSPGYAAPVYSPPAYVAPGYEAPAPAQGYQNPHGYAVDTTRGQQDAVAGRILQEGYIHQPPEWVQKQAHDRCPHCRGVNYAQISHSRYGGTTNIYGRQGHMYRCFDCGYSNSEFHEGALNQYSGMRGSGPVVGHARQTATGGANLRNFGEIKV